MMHVIWIAFLILGVRARFYQDCNLISSTLECKKTTFISPKITEIAVRELRSFNATDVNFPNLQVLRVEKSSVPCAILLERLRNVNVTVNGKDCERVIYLNLSVLEIK